MFKDIKLYFAKKSIFYFEFEFDNNSNDFCINKLSNKLFNDHFNLGIRIFGMDKGSIGHLYFFAQIKYYINVLITVLHF